MQAYLKRQSPNIIKIGPQHASANDLGWLFSKKFLSSVPLHPKYVPISIGINAVKTKGKIPKNNNF